MQLRKRIGCWIAAVGIVAFGFAANAIGDDCDVPSDMVLSDGYLVGRELLALADEGLAAYINGFINATSLSVAFGAKSECIERAHQCIAHLCLWNCSDKTPV